VVQLENDVQIKLEGVKLVLDDLLVDIQLGRTTCDEG
jgi:hypothetical protein